MKHPKCCKCSKKIFPYGVNIDGKKFHRNCLRCESCRSLLQDYSFRQKKGSYYCTNCYQKKWCKRCAACHQLITGNLINAHDNDYHNECFKCEECQKFLGVDFNFYLWNGILLCPVDFKRKKRENGKEMESHLTVTQNGARKYHSTKEKDGQKNKIDNNAPKSKSDSFLYCLIGWCI